MALDRIRRHCPFGPGPDGVFLHRPLARVRPGDPKSTLRVVVSGHTHQYLDLVMAGVRHVWMPSSGFVLPDEMQPGIGEELVGIGLLELHDETMRFDLWCPDGMVRHEHSSMPAYQVMAADNHGGRTFPKR